MRYFNEPSEDEENPVYPCGFCSKKITEKMKSVQCDLCNYWNHIKCDDIDDKTYEALKKSTKSELYYCKVCREEIFLFKHFPMIIFFINY